MELSVFKSSNPLSFIALTILFLALVIINNVALQGVRLDLTENKLYTLSDGIKDILSDIKEPVALYLFFSSKSAKDHPSLKNYYARVRTMLEEYKQYAHGMLEVYYIDPEPFSEEEDRATQMGLQNISIASAESLYFGIAGTNTLDDVEVIPFLQQDKEIFLEYDLGKLIYTLTRLKKPVLGLLTSLNMYPTKLDPNTGRMNDAWVITDQIEQLFDVKLVHSTLEEVDEDIDVLMIVHPKLLGEKAFYAIDQFIMRGGKGLFFVDPYSNEQFVATSADSPLPDTKAKSSSLNRLFNKWGFSVDEDSVIGDSARAIRVSLSTGQQHKHIAILGTKPEDFSSDDPILEGLQLINFAMASYVKLNQDSTLNMEVMIESSKSAGLIPLQRFRFIRHPEELRQGLVETGEKYPIMARITGKMKSAFKAPPEGLETNKEQIMKTTEDANLIVVADTDLLADNLWAQVQRFLGTKVLRPIASNRDLVINSIENLFGNNALISIRSRASYSRPFIKVQEIEQSAEKKFRDTEEKLRNDYTKFQRRLTDLQQQKTDKNEALLSKEQRKEKQELQKKIIEVRKALRNVRHQLVKDIEELGDWLKIINIAFMPGIVIIIALIVAHIRSRKQRRRV